MVCPRYNAELAVLLGLMEVATVVIGERAAWVVCMLRGEGAAAAS